MEDESGLQEISWYHGELSRHQAEALLMSNGALGSYLLRKSRESGQLAVSVKCQDSVKHFLVKCSDGKIKFGFSEFQSLPELLAHFSQKPLVGSETGTLVLLHLPYPRQVSEPQTYESVRIHTALHGEPELLEPHADSLATKEGFLTKQGFIIKSWKLRWFTVFRHEMKYYKEPRDAEAIKTLDLTRCSAVQYDYTQDRTNVFCLVFPERTYYMYADSPRETDEWVRLLRWKLSHINQDGCKTRFLLAS
ncbi:dual adapter for phosphotyrosine and 3-phosphotyrosine and 3-phosphoinositide-like isoform X2 [Lampetra fluviatilis]